MHEESVFKGLNWWWDAEWHSKEWEIIKGDKMGKILKFQN